MNNTGNTTQLLTSFNALDVAQQKVLLSSKLLTEEQKAQCLTMATLSSANTKYTAEQLTKATGISAETLATWGLTEATDTLTMSQLAEMASSDAQAKSVLEKIIAQNAQAVANGEVTASNVTLAASEGGATLATGAFTTAIKANISAMKTWLLTTPAGWITAAVGVIFLAVKAYDALTTSVEEQKEKMEESLSAYEDAKSELSSVTTELENQKQAMDELLAKEKLTYAEKGQLEELQAITQELRIQKDLAEKEEGRTKKEVATDASDLFKKQFGKYDISESAINEYQNNEDIIDNNAILISDENNISAMIAGYRQFNELLAEAYGEGNQENIDHFKSLTDDLKDSIFTTAQDLQEQQSNISDYYNTIKDTPYDDLTTEQKEIVDSYNAISNAIALIYKQLDPNTWNSMQIDNIFSTDGIEKTKDELVAMAKEGTLNESTINGYNKLKQALDENGISAKELYDEIQALAGVVSEDTIQNTIKSAKDKFKTESIDITPYKEALDDEYQKIQDWGLEDYADKIKNGTIQSVFGNVDMDKRTIITWSDELKQTYADALASWDYDPEVGSIDTVFGGSNRFGEELNGVGWEVAFTPILPDGTFLSQDAVYDYINTILEEAYANDGKVTEDELVAIDAQGRQIGNTFVHGIFAGIDDSQNYDNNGNWAETVGRLMHFSGDFGAVQIAKDAIEKAQKQESDFDWDSWFKENSINTQEEIDRWNKIAESATNAADARKKYTEGEEGNKTDILSFSDAWEQLKNSTEDATKGLADNLTELAYKGQLTVEALSEADTTDFFENAGISAEEAVDKINELVDASTQLNALSTQISKMSDMLADKKNGTVASASDLAGFDVEVRGLDSWEEFEKVMGSAESTMGQCQKAANDLATEWVNNGNFLSNLTDENKDYYITQLNNMGIENAEAIVTEALAQKKNDLALATQFAEEKGKDLSKATVDEITKFADEHNMAGEARNALYRLALAKKGVSAATLTFDGDITNIKNFVQSIGSAAYALAEMEAIKKNPSAYVPSEVKQKILDQARTEVSNATNTPVEVDIDLKDTGSSNYKGSGGKSGGSSKDAKKKFSETFDWIEVRIKRLERAISNYDNVIDNTYNSWSKRNKALEKEITKITSLITAQQKAQDTYKKKANKVTVKNTSEDGKSTKKQEEAFKKYKKLVREGSLKISDIKDEDVANAIKKYQEYYEKSLDAKDSKAETQKQLLDAYVKKFEMVSEKYDSIIGIYDTKKSNWETAYKGNIEAQGRDMNLAETKEYTSKRNSYEEKTQAQLEKERAELKKKQAEAVKKGLRKDSQEYKDMEKAILEVDQALQESKNIVANTAQEIREAAIAEFNETSEKYDSIISIFDANKSTMDSTIKNAIESTGRQMNYGEASVYYNNLNNIQASTQAQLVNEIAELQQKLAQAVANGVDQNSNDYRSMQAELINAQNALQDSKNAVNENTLALLQTKWSDIQKDIDILDETLSDSEFTRKMILNMGDLYTKSVGSKPTEITGTMTDYGKATLSTYFNDINTNQAKIAKAQEGYKDVLSKLATDPNNDAYKNQANSFKQEIYDATLAIYSSKDEIISLYSDMFNEMLDSLKKISDNTMNQLQTEKDLYDYQKSIREKTDNISLLQRQLNVYKNDTSESGKMNYQQIKSQLEEAKTDLGDTEYSRFLSDTQSLLDQMNDDASDWVEQTLADKTQLITDALKTVNSSIGSVQGIINTVNSSIIGVQTAISNLNSSTSGANNSTTTDTNKSTTTPVMPGGMDVVPTITLDTPAIPTPATPLPSRKATLSEKLESVIFPSSGLKKGEKNNIIALVKQALTKLGYKGLNSNGSYGDVTAKAVKQFYADHTNISAKTADGTKLGKQGFKKLISVLKAKGYSRGGVITDDDFDLSNLGIRTNNGDTKLITVKNGERVLTPIQNQNFEELIKYLQANPIVPNIPTNLVSNIPQAKNVGGNSYSTNIERVDLSFPDVTNYEDFVQKLKHDNTTLKYIAAQTAGAYVGKNSLKNRL